MRKALKVIGVIVLCMSMMVGIIPDTVEATTDGIVASGTFGDNLTWKLTSEGNNLILAISGKGDMSNERRIPWYEYRERISDVTIAKGITSIGYYAFYGCSGLTTVTIPKGVTSINYSAFENCTSLATVSIPNSVIHIGYHAFSGCSSLTTISIPSSVTGIGPYAFEYCSSLKSITIPKGVTSIGFSAFRYCTSLATVSIPNSVIGIGPHAFENCTSLATVSIPNSVNSIDYNAFSGCSSLSSVKIAKGVKKIGRYAFEDCTELTSVIIPDGVEFVGYKAFNNCKNLTSITIPNSVQDEPIRDILYGADGLADIYYTGTKKQWEKVGTSYDDQVLIHCKDGLIHKVHNYTEKITQKPSCAKEGTKKYTCSKCGEWYTEAISKENHEFIEKLIEKPSCTKEGTKKYTCSKCSYWYTEVIPMNEHLFDDGKVVNPARDGNNGLMVYTCKTCGYKDEQVIYPCSHCSGNGKVLQGESKKKTVTCPTCMGSGKIGETEKVRTVIACSSCGGTGKKEKTVVCPYCVVGKINGVRCSACNGRGGWFVKENCSSCSGTGRVSGPIYFEKKDCSSCRGSGRVTQTYLENAKYVECNQCGGNDYNISYNSNGGKGAPDPQVLHTLKSVELSKEVPTRKNMEFEGWSTTSNGLVEYKPGDTIQEQGKDIVLYAVWKASKSISKASISNIRDKEYTGKEITQNPSVKYEGTTLKNGTDYKITYKNNTEIGTAIVIITGIGKYCDEVVNTFEILTCKHKWNSGKVTTPATETKTGVKTYTCTVCKQTKTETIPKATHAVTRTIRRAYGDNRYDTSFAIADAYLVDSGKVKSVTSITGNKRTPSLNAIIVACGTNYPDALAASYLASVKKAPVIVWREKDNAKVQEYIKANLKSGGYVYIMGGTGAVSGNIAKGLSGYKFIRYGDENRYGTNVKILNAAKVTGGEILVCEGTDFKNALIASATGKPILLVKPTGVTREGLGFLAGLKNASFTIIGNESSVSKAVETQLAAYGKVTRVSGANPDEVSVNVAKKYFTNPKQVMVATSETFPDGLCGGVLAIQDKAPILLLTDKQNSKSVAYTKTLANLEKVTAFGGYAVVSDALAKKLLNVGTKTTDILEYYRTTDKSTGRQTLKVETRKI